MGQVHEVVDHQAIVGLDVKQPAVIGPFWVVMPLQIRDQCRVCGLLVARPDPDKTIALLHGIALDCRKTTHTLARHGNGLAVAAHLQAMVATNQLAFAHTAQRQRGATVRTKILYRCNLVLQRTVENHAFTADLTAQRLVCHFSGTGCDIPGIARVNLLLGVWRVHRGSLLVFMSVSMSVFWRKSTACNYNSAPHHC